MNNVNTMRRDVKKYIDTADEKVVKMVHAMLEVDSETHWWDSVPETVKRDVEIALEESEKGKVTPHEEIQKRYHKWIAK